ncbi:MAG: UDP-N-acetylmuramate dehydrogenase [Bacillota bacterium]
MAQAYSRERRAVLAEQLREKIPGLELVVDAPMSEHTSFHIGGPADLLAAPADEEALRRMLIWAREAAVPLTVIGRGTNLLVRDRGVRGLVVRVGPGLDGTEVSDSVISAGAGLPLAELSRLAAARGLAGLAWACGIPGSLGGALVMNAGAYKGEMKDVVRRVEVMRPDGTRAWLSAADLDFAYRRSALQGADLVALRGELGLKPGDRSAIAAEMADNDRRRAESQPLELPSAGSVFRRPPGHYVGPTITAAGLRGARVGGAQVSEKHAGFIVNRDGATADDVLELIERIRTEVRAKFKVDLVSEIKVIGEG